MSTLFPQSSRPDIVRRLYRGLVVLAAGLLVTSIVTGCSTVPITGRSQLSLVDDSQMLTLSKQQYAETLSESKISTDSAANAQVVRVGRRIADAVDKYNKEIGSTQVFEWEFKVIDDPKTVNAWCMPGGKIAVYTGILPLTQDDVGLAVVLGHEVGHALARHGSERVSQGMAAEAGTSVIGAMLSGKSEMAQQSAALAANVVLQYGVLMPYGRSQELEADNIGLILMAKAGYDPRAAVPFWERMAQASGGQEPPQFLSTHPSNANRIAQIKQKLPEAIAEYDKARKP